MGDVQLSKKRVNNSFIEKDNILFLRAVYTGKVKHKLTIKFKYVQIMIKGGMVGVWLHYNREG